MENMNSLNSFKLKIEFLPIDIHSFNKIIETFKIKDNLRSFKLQIYDKKFYQLGSKYQENFMKSN